MVDLELTKGCGHHLNAIYERHRKFSFKLSDIKLQKVLVKLFS